MTIVIITNYACVSYDIDTDLSKEEVAHHLEEGMCLFDLKNGTQVIVNAANAVSVELKDTPLEQK